MAPLYCSDACWPAFLRKSSAARRCGRRHKRSGPCPECRQGCERDYGYPGRHSAGFDRQSGLRHRPAVGFEGSLIVGASYGRGVMTCRGGENFRGPWSAPSMMALEGGSFGFQIGGQATDFVLLIMNERGASAILSSKVKLGADASAAAGPVGRTAAAATDVTMRAEVLTYSRSRGLFAGVSLEGSTLRPDNDANERLYGKKVEAKAIVFRKAVPIPPSAKLLIAT